MKIYTWGRECRWSSPVVTVGNVRVDVCEDLLAINEMEFCPPFSQNNRYKFQMRIQKLIFKKRLINLPCKIILKNFNEIMKFRVTNAGRSKSSNPQTMILLVLRLLDFVPHSLMKWVMISSTGEKEVVDYLEFSKGIDRTTRTEHHCPNYHNYSRQIWSHWSTWSWWVLCLFRSKTKLKLTASLTHVRFHISKIFFSHHILASDKEIWREIGVRPVANPIAPLDAQTP